MTQAQFMYELMTAVQSLSDEVQYVIMNDYNQYFFDKKEQGMTEDQITASLPSPEKIADEYKHGMITPVDGMKTIRRTVPPARITPLGVTLFILLIPVCAVYETLAVTLGLAAAVFMLALCIVLAFASVACFGVSSLSVGFIVMGIGGLFVTVASVLFGASLLKGIAAAVTWFPCFMKRVLKNQKGEAAA